MEILGSMYDLETRVDQLGSTLNYFKNELNNNEISQNDKKSIAQTMNELESQITLDTDHIKTLRLKCLEFKSIVGDLDKINNNMTCACSKKSKINNYMLQKRESCEECKNLLYKYESLGAQYENIQKVYNECIMRHKKMTSEMEKLNEQCEKYKMIALQMTNKNTTLSRDIIDIENKYTLSLQEVSKLKTQKEQYYEPKINELTNEIDNKKKEHEKMQHMLNNLRESHKMEKNLELKKIKRGSI